jgi:5-methylcytosine-specific restriction endonuclease McrA
MKEYKITGELKKIVRLRAKNCCEYCLSQEKFAPQKFSIEHIFPVSKGGKTTSDNLALACQGCNNHKYNKTEEYDELSNQVISLFNPRKDHWQDHFRWNNNYKLIIAITPKGRVTIKVLRLNREGLVNLRHILYLVGHHPPII